MRKVCYCAEHHDAHGEIIARDASGMEREVFRIPIGSAASVIAVGSCSGAFTGGSKARGGLVELKPYGAR